MVRSRAIRAASHRHLGGPDLNPGPAGHPTPTRIPLSRKQVRSLGIERWPALLAYGRIVPAFDAACNQFLFISEKGQFPSALGCLVPPLYQGSCRGAPNRRWSFPRRNAAESSQADRDVVLLPQLRTAARRRSAGRCAERVGPGSGRARGGGATETSAARASEAGRLARGAARRAREGDRSSMVPS